MVGRGVKFAALASSPKWQYALLLLIVVFEYLRPTDWLLAFLAPLRLGGIATLMMVIVFLMSEKRYLRDELIHRLALAFIFSMAISSVFAPNTRAVFDVTVAMLWTICAFVFPVNVILCSKDRLFRFVYFWIGVQAILALL